MVKKTSRDIVNARLRKASLVERNMILGDGKLSIEDVVDIARNGTKITLFGEMRLSLAKHMN